MRALRSCGVIIVFGLLFVFAVWFGVLLSRFWVFRGRGAAFLALCLGCLFSVCGFGGAARDVDFRLFGVVCV